MKTIFALMISCASCLFLCPSTRAQCSVEDRKEMAAEAELHREELVNLVRETARAVQLKNPSFFHRVYGDDFVGTAPNGTMLDKAGLIAYVEHAPATYETFVVSDVRIRIFQDTAVITSVWSARGTRAGRIFSRQSRVMQIFVYGQRGWQAVASQETLLPG
jgi:hypothetical protein